MPVTNVDGKLCDILSSLHTDEMPLLLAEIVELQRRHGLKFSVALTQAALAKGTDGTYRPALSDTTGRLVVATQQLETLNAFHRPAAATQAAASLTLLDGFSTYRVSGQIIITAVNVQAALLLKLSDNGLISYWETNVVVPAGQTLVVPVPPVDIVAVTQLNVVAAAPAAGNFAAAFISGYRVVP